MWVKRVEWCELTKHVAVLNDEMGRTEECVKKQGEVLATVKNNQQWVMRLQWFVLVAVMGAALANIIKAFGW